MNIEQRIDCLQLDNDCSVHEEIEAISIVNDQVLVLNRTEKLLLKIDRA
jgi:hypothetical protein